MTSSHVELSIVWLAAVNNSFSFASWKKISIFFFLFFSPVSHQTHNPLARVFTCLRRAWMGGGIQNPSLGLIVNAPTDVYTISFSFQQHKCYLSTLMVIKKKVLPISLLKCSLNWNTDFNFPVSSQGNKKIKKLVSYHSFSIWIMWYRLGLLYAVVTALGGKRTNYNMGSKYGTEAHCCIFLYYFPNIYISVNMAQSYAYVKMMTLELSIT